MLISFKDDYKKNLKHASSFLAGGGRSRKKINSYYLNITVAPCVIPLYAYILFYAYLVL